MSSLSVSPKTATTLRPVQAGYPAEDPVSVFLSHGSPALILEENDPTLDFFADFGQRLPRPAAVVSVSAHWGTVQPAVSLASKPETIYDFYGFPDALYRKVYPAAGAPDVARKVAELLTVGGMPCGMHPSRGLDHGAWVPMLKMWPEADIPVFQLSIQPRENAAHHLAVGRLLRPLAEQGVLILASGSITHNLGMMDRTGHSGPPAWARQFTDWVTDKLLEGDEAALLDWDNQAPAAHLAHPTDEHFLPLFVALGAAGPGAVSHLLHDNYTYGSLGMHAYGFTPAATG